MRLGQCWFIRLIFLHQLSFFSSHEWPNKAMNCIGISWFLSIVKILLTYIFGQPYSVSTILWKWGWKLSTPETYSNNMQTIGKQLCPIAQDCSCVYRLDLTFSTPLLIFIDQWWQYSVPYFCKKGGVFVGLFSHITSLGK